jgi:hypothetical protein
MPEDKPQSETKLLDTAKKRFKLAQETMSKQREREKDDLRFQVPEEQWDESARRQRLGQAVDGVPTPARPVLSISKIDQPIQLVLNQERSARLGVSIQPLSPDAEDDVAKILEGIYRRIERDSQAHIARSWAFDRAVKCGRGAYRIRTDWDDESDDDMDQEIRIERILHQESVYFDPAATKPDWSDGEWAFITAWMARDTFEREFPDAQETGGDELAWEQMVAESPEWVRGDGEKAAVLVAEYFYKEHDIQEVGRGKRKRKKDIVTVKWAKMSGFEVLEEGELDGRYIVSGRELQPFDEERHWTGIIGPAKDAQRLYNYAASQAVEMAALEPKAPWVGYEGQFEGHEDWWAQSNVRNIPYLEAKAKTLDSGADVLPLPQRVQVDMGRLGPSMQLLQQADNFIQTTMATHDPSLGRFSDREKSGRAIMALQQQGEAANSHYLQNLAMAMEYEAKVILDLIPAIYDRPGRIARTLDEEGEGETILVNQRFYREPGEAGRPIPLRDGEEPPIPAGPPPGPPPGAPPPPGMPPPGAPVHGGPPVPQGPPMQPPAPPEVKHYDLRKGIYSVAVSIGKQRQTALQEGAEEIGQILQARPEMMPILGPIYFKYREFPGADSIAEDMRKLRDKQFPFLAEGDDGQPTPEQMQSQMDQMGQQLQMMGAQLQAAIKAIETEQAKQQATLQKAEMDNMTKIRLAEIKAQSEVQLESMKGEFRAALEEIKAVLAREQGAFQRGHESEEKDRDREHETVMKVTDAALEPPDMTFRGEAETAPGGEGSD